MLGIRLWTLYFTIRKLSEKMIRMMMLELVERRFPSSWTSLKEAWYLLHYDKVELKLGRYLKEGHGTVSVEVCFQVGIGISILQVIDKYDSDRLQTSGLNQSSCSVLT